MPTGGGALLPAGQPSWGARRVSVSAGLPPPPPRPRSGRRRRRNPRALCLKPTCVKLAAPRDVGWPTPAREVPPKGGGWAVPRRRRRGGRAGCRAASQSPLIWTERRVPEAMISTDVPSHRHHALSAWSASPSPGKAHARGSPGTELAWRGHHGGDPCPGLALARGRALHRPWPGPRVDRVGLTPPGKMRMEAWHHAAARRPSSACRPRQAWGFACPPSHPAKRPPRQWRPTLRSSGSRRLRWSSGSRRRRAAASTAPPCQQSTCW